MFAELERGYRSYREGRGKNAWRQIDRRRGLGWPVRAAKANSHVGQANYRLAVSHRQHGLAGLAVKPPPPFSKQGGGCCKGGPGAAGGPVRPRRRSFSHRIFCWGFLERRYAALEAISKPRWGGRHSTAWGITRVFSPDYCRQFTSQRSGRRCFGKVVLVRRKFFPVADGQCIEDAVVFVVSVRFCLTEELCELVRPLSYSRRRSISAVGNRGEKIIESEQFLTKARAQSMANTRTGGFWDELIWQPRIHLWPGKRTWDGCSGVVRCRPIRRLLTNCPKRALIFSCGTGAARAGGDRRRRRKPECPLWQKTLHSAPKSGDKTLQVTKRSLAAG